MRLAFITAYYATLIHCQQQYLSINLYPFYSLSSKFWGLSIFKVRVAERKFKPEFEIRIVCGRRYRK
jgi:hypothetical protein